MNVVLIRRTVRYPQCMTNTDHAGDDHFQPVFKLTSLPYARQRSIDPFTESPCKPSRIHGIQPA